MSVDIRAGTGELNILHLEDNPNDTELVQSLLRSEGIKCHFKVVSSREDFEKTVDGEKFDLILSDFTLPSFNGNAALSIVRKKSPDTPFIFVSGTIGEELAVEGMRNGATDYVLKTRLERLVPVIKRALGEAEEKRKRRQAEQASAKAIHDLQASEARFRGLLEFAPDPTIIIDGNGKIIFANERSAEVFGYSREEIIGSPLGKLVPERFRKRHEGQVVDFHGSPHARPMGTGLELYACRKDGTEFSADIMLAPLKVDGEYSVLAIIRDTTASKLAAEALKESEERLRTIYELSPLGIVTVDSAGHFLQCNPAATVIFGYSVGELLNMTVGELTHPDDRGLSFNYLGDLENGTSDLVEFEKRYVRKDGKAIWAHLTASAVRDSQGKFLYTITVLEDITDRKDAEDAVRTSEERYRRLVESARDAIFSLSTEGKITSLNTAFKDMTGWEAGEWIGKPFFSLMHPDDRDKAALNFRAVIRGERVGINQYKVMTRSGKYLKGEFSTTAEIYDEKTVGLLGIARDVTEQEKMEEYFRRVQKMESLGTLAGGIAHDFNNILGIILGFVGLIDRASAKNEKMTRYINSVSAATNRGIALVRQLLTFARKEEKTLEHVDLNEVVRETYKLAEETFPRKIAFQLSLDEGVPIIIADQSQIHQVLLNLCVNARDAMLDRNDGKPSGGILKITTTVVNGEAVRTTFPGAKYSEYVQISVADTGIGMDETTRSRIFEPFFTTKERGKGTGLGLSTVYGVVEGHEGFIDVSSQVGIGTTFSIYLPSRPAATPETDTQNMSTETEQGGTETILVVEDEEMLRELLESVLTEKGYKVLAAGDGENAVSIFEKNAGEIQLVLSDLGLPKLGGIDMLRSLRKLKPDVKVLFASGFVEPRDREWMTENGVTGFLAKPYRISEVLKIVREVLDH